MRDVDMNDFFHWLRPDGESRFAGTLAALVVGILFLVPEPALALQEHESPEGLVAHQLAHVFFGTTMGILAYWLESNRFVRSLGWRLIQIACLLLVLWNIVTFTAHMTALQIGKDAIGSRPDTWIWTPETRQWARAVNSMLSLDHLVCVPAVLFLWLGFRKLYQEICGSEKGLQ